MKKDRRYLYFCDSNALPLVSWNERLHFYGRLFRKRKSELTTATREKIAHLMESSPLEIITNKQANYREQLFIST